MRGLIVMIKSMNYINLSELGAAIDAKHITDFIFFHDTESNDGTFLYCDEETLDNKIHLYEYYKSQNSNFRYLTKYENDIKAIKFLREHYDITDKIFIYFD